MRFGESEQDYESLYKRASFAFYKQKELKQWEMFWALQLQFLNMTYVALYHLYTTDVPKCESYITHEDLATDIALHLSGMK